MKYLKEYNHEFYYEIPENEFRLLGQNKICKLSEEDIDLLSKHFGELRMPELSQLYWRLIRIQNDEVSIAILKDEWYLVKVTPLSYPGSVLNRKYFKCDQLEGLLKLINDLKNEIH